MKKQNRTSANVVIGALCLVWLTLFLVLHESDTIQVDIHDNNHGYSMDDMRRSLENIINTFTKNPFMDLSPLTKVIERQEETLSRIEDSIRNIKDEIRLQDINENKAIAIVRKKRNVVNEICPVQSPKLLGFLIVNEVTNHDIVLRDITVLFRI